MENNPFLPYNAKTYGDLLRPIDENSLVEGLLGYGLFGDKLPPIFTSEAFCTYIRSLPNPGSKGSRDWIRYRYIRNVGSFREFGIPDPFAYAHLVFHLGANWDNLKQYFWNVTKTHPYRASRISIRKIAGKKQLFEMNYKNALFDAEPLPAIAVGKRYRVRCDISRCFPSIYTHALEWALAGKDIAKKRKKGRAKKRSWEGLVDFYAQNTTNGETHGLLIGPHASNLLADIILVKIDDELFKSRYDFIRHIDDFECYTDSFERAESFPIELEKCLAKYGLSINQKKTSICTLPDMQRDWTKQLSDYPVEGEKIKASVVEGFLNLAQACMKESGNDAAVLNYALKKLRKADLAYGAERYLAAVGAHLLYLYPYLLTLADSCIFSKSKMREDQIAFVIRKVFKSSLFKRDYWSANYCIYFSLKYKFDLDLPTKDEIKQTDDCLFMLFAWLYFDIRNDVSRKDEMKDIAKELYGADDFDRFWIFVFEAFDKDDFDPNKKHTDWKGLKNKRVSFIDRSGLA